MIKHKPQGKRDRDVDIILLGILLWRQIYGLRNMPYKRDIKRTLKQEEKNIKMYYDKS